MHSTIELSSHQIRFYCSILIKDIMGNIFGFVFDEQEMQSDR